MAGRVSKVVGGAGLALAIVAAGAGGVTWLTSRTANVADGQVASQQAPTPTAPSTSAPPPVGQIGDNLTLDVKPSVNSYVLTEEWIVAAGAKVDEFPLEKTFRPELSCLRTEVPDNKAMEKCLGSKPGCTPAQRAWLEGNAILVRRGSFSYNGMLSVGTVNLKNNSTSAQSITFKDIKLEAELSPISDAGFSIGCTNYNDWAGGASAGPATVRDVLLGASPGTGVFGAPLAYGEDLTRQLAEGTPAIFNLAAGEASAAALVVKTPRAVGKITGKVVATVSASDGEREVNVPLPLLDAGPLYYSTAPRTILWVDGGTVCPPAPQGSKYAARSVCSVEQLKAGAQVG